MTAFWSSVLSAIREPQRHPVRERICHREGCARHSRRRLEGDLHSDAAVYGGANVGNLGAAIWSSHHRLNAVIPANGFVVLVKQ
jgi:hypothetical protein